MGYIYLGRHSQTDLYKIGQTRYDVDARTRDHVASNPDYNCIAAYYVEEDVRVEKDLHRKFRQSWSYGDWFQLTNEDLAAIDGYIEIMGGRKLDTVYPKGSRNFVDHLKSSASQRTTAAQPLPSTRVALEIQASIQKYRTEKFQNAKEWLKAHPDHGMTKSRLAIHLGLSRTTLDEILAILQSEQDIVTGE